MKVSLWMMGPGCRPSGRCCWGEVTRRVSDRPRLDQRRAHTTAGPHVGPAPGTAQARRSLGVAQEWRGGGLAHKVGYRLNPPSMGPHRTRFPAPLHLAWVAAPLLSCSPRRAAAGHRWTPEAAAARWTAGALRGRRGPARARRTRSCATAPASPRDRTTAAAWRSRAMRAPRPREAARPASRATLAAQLLHRRVPGRPARPCTTAATWPRQPANGCSARGCAACARRTWRRRTSAAAAAAVTTPPASTASRTWTATAPATRWPSAPLREALSVARVPQAGPRSVGGLRRTPAAAPATRPTAGPVRARRYVQYRARHRLRQPAQEVRRALRAVQTLVKCPPRTRARPARWPA